MQKVQKIGRNDPCWCGSGHKYKDCHLDFDAKLSEYRRKGSKIPTHAMIKNPEQIAAIRESAKIDVAVWIMWQSISTPVSQQNRSTFGCMSRLLIEAASRLH